MPRKLIWAGVGVLVVGLSVGSWYLIRPALLPESPVVPSPAEVERITVRCHQAGAFPDGTEEFQVPPEYVADVLRVFGTPKAGRASKYAEVEATLRVTCRDGRELQVRVYDRGQAPVEYDVDGVYCIRDGPYVDTANNPANHPGASKYMHESVALVQAIRLMEKQPMSPETREIVRHCFELLGRSAGR